MFLVTGAGGQLGQELRLLLGDRAVYVGHGELDIADEAAVRSFFAARTFDFIINCAAYTAVDRAEDDVDTADRVNRIAPGLLARYGHRIIHISTDYVFDGTSSRPYGEKDRPHPVSVYGRTKLEGENAVLRAGETALVIRTAWLYSVFGHNFVKTVRRLGEEKSSLDVVFDQTGTPTYAADLAAAIVNILPCVTPGMKEVYHYSDEGVASRYDFAVAILEAFGIDCTVRPVESSEYPSRAVRPAYSVLNKMKIKRDFGVVIPHWMQGLRQCVEKMKRET